MNSTLHLSDPGFTSRRVATSAVRSHPLLGALLAATVLATGCGDAILDFRNAEISNGKIFKGGADTAFTGTVTNIPADRIFSQHLGMGRLAKTIVPVAGEGAAIDPIMKSSSSLCDAKIDKGVLDGAVTCKSAQGGSLRYQAKFENGTLQGPFTWYDRAPGDLVLATATFKDGLLEGTQEIFSPKTKQRIQRVRWHAGKADGDEEVWHPETGQQIGLFHYKDDLLEGEATRWSADGKTVTYRTTLVEGKQNGVEEEFYPETGKPFRRTEWSHGKKNGRFQEWDAQGSLTHDVAYRNDSEQMKPAIAPRPEPTTAESTPSNASAAMSKETCAQAKAAYQLKDDSRQGASQSDIDEMKAACSSEVKRPS